MRFAQQDDSAFPFDATAGPGYVWHCHLLEHGDNEMMRPYKLAAPASAVLPIAVASAVAGAAVLSGAYYCQKRRKKRTSGKENPDESSHVMSREEQMPEEENRD